MRFVAPVQALQSLIRRRWAKSMSALMGIHVCGVLLPLITIPYLARALGPDQWGIVALSQALGAYGCLVIEYGFGLSATREIAKCEHAPIARSHIVADVLSAKAVLCVITSILLLLAGFAVPAFRVHPALVLLTIPCPIAQGLDPSWYFQGMQRMRSMATMSITVRIIAVAAIIILVRRPEHAWRALAITAASSTAANGIGLILMYRDVAFTRLSIRTGVRSIREGWNFFVLRGAVSLFSSMNPLLLAAFATPAAVGNYVNGDKIQRSLWSISGPITQALLPHLSRTAELSPIDAATRSRRVLVCFVVLACAISAFILLVAPYAVQILFGVRYLPSIPVLRVLALAVPLSAFNGGLGYYWLIPMGRERAYSRIVVVAGLVCLATAYPFVKLLGATGMACSVLAAEMIQTGILTSCASNRPVLFPTRHFGGQLTPQEDLVKRCA